ncbi:hypothetical protein HMPREF9440_02097 [Sutterella parvirubra YIT 11816]|uniref:Uncharacterized protein n=1 Tax=Sutterella parvirubra YIT 11816 TaxID=762967 RepID=H3KH57_9BURK|nr:hypothetical protein HMPREF9440_02097 [Sutterella parvirubra YIT 11816]
MWSLLWSDGSVRFRTRLTRELGAKAVRGMVLVVRSARNRSGPLFAFLRPRAAGQSNHYEGM